MEKKKISIVTPSYNQGQYLEETIDSVLSQGYDNLEYIIMDGGSTDNSVDIIKKYEKYLSYWVSEKDGGQPNALKKGFSLSTGEILGWINSDDKYVAGTFDKINDAFLANKNTEFVYGDYFLLFNDQRLVAKPKISWDFNIALYAILPFGQPSSFWTKNIYEKVGGLDVNYQYIFDYEFFLRVGAELKNNPDGFKHIHDYYSYFRIHDESKTVSQHEKFRQENKILRKQFGVSQNKLIRKTKQYYYLFAALKKYYNERGFIPLKTDNKEDYA